MPDQTAPTLAAVEAAAAAVADAVALEEGPMTPNKRRIVETAVLAFAEQGYAATTTRDIARRAGVSEAAIFRHFSTKKELLRRLVEPLAKHVAVPSGIAELREALAEGGSLEQVARRLMRNRLALLRRFAPIVRILLQEAPFHPELQAVLRRQLPGIRTRVAVLIGAEVAAGRMRPVPIDRLMRWVVSLFLGYFLASTFLAPGADWDDEAEIAETARFLAQGLATDAD